MTVITVCLLPQKHELCHDYFVFLSLAADAHLLSLWPLTQHHVEHNQAVSCVCLVLGTRFRNTPGRHRPERLHPRVDGVDLVSVLDFIESFMSFDTSK